jgi:hypothetical protein
VIVTRAALTFIIRRKQYAIIGNVALDAHPLPIANFRLADDTRRTGGNVRIRWNAGDTYIIRTRIHVVWNIGIIVDDSIHTTFADV